MFPLSTVLFPGASMPLHVFEPRYRALMHDCLAADSRFGVVLIERGSEVGGGDVRASLGTRGLITKSIEMPDGRWLLQVMGESVVAVEEWLPDDPYPVALVRERTGAPEAEPRPPPARTPRRSLEAATQRVRRARALLAEHGGAPPLSPDLALDGDGDPQAASWELCAAAPVSAYDAQRLLAAGGAAARAAAPDRAHGGSRARSAAHAHLGVTGSGRTAAWGRGGMLREGDRPGREAEWPSRRRKSSSASSRTGPVTVRW